MPKRWFAEADPFAPLQYRYPIKRVLYSRRSRFQTIQVMENEFFGRMLVLDRVVQLTERDEFLYHEMLAHVPLHSHPAPARVLVIGGGDGGTLREVLKHPSVQQAVLVELDPRVVEVAKQFFRALAVGFSDPRVTVLHDDGARCLRETEERFDAILVDSTDPVGPARSLSTPQFFRAAAQALDDGGIFAMQTESLHYHAGFVNRVQASLRGVFPSVDLYGVPIATYAGNWWTFALARHGPLGREPVRPPVAGTRFYCEEVHRSAFVPSKALACFTALGSRRRGRRGRWAGA